MKTQITEVSIFQNANFLAVLYMPISLIYAIIGLFLILTGLGELIFLGIIFILTPIWLTVMIYLMVAILSVYYNFVASIIGGVEFELTEMPEKEEFPKDDFGV